MSAGMEKEPGQHKTSAEAPGEAEHDEVIEAGASLEYFKALREKAGESGISNVQRADFKTAVALDELKKPDQRMGLKQLYALWCEKGNAKWLNPSKELGRLRDICLLYMGNVSTLRPLVQILLKLTNHGVSPHAFLHYVVLPRMGDDFDWRQWHLRHFGALSIIADMVIEIKKHPPFDKEILGSSSYPLARDIVIIKYFARPLCSLSEKQLGITEYQKAYIDLWRGFYLDNSLRGAMPNNSGTQ
ncbi:MAG TPA: hypothetical protein PKW28_12565, partial [Turneriella sp.]|nr:hypothetical protein [Turneriella sp.]